MYIFTIYLCFLHFYTHISASLVKRTLGDAGWMPADAEVQLPSGLACGHDVGGGLSPFPRHSLVYVWTPPWDGWWWRWLSMGGQWGGRDHALSNWIWVHPDSLLRASFVYDQNDSFCWKSQFMHFLSQPLHWPSLWLWKALALRLWWN